jgi:hypothetical protein
MEVYRHAVEESKKGNLNMVFPGDGFHRGCRLCVITVKYAFKVRLPMSLLWMFCQSQKSYFR